MKSIRKIHLLLGCFFAPALLFFTVSGALQTFNLHHDRKNGSYTAPKPVVQAAQVHIHRKIPPGMESGSLRWFILAMCLGITVTGVLGVVMALRALKPAWLVWAMLAAGVGLPLLMLSLSSSPGNSTGPVPGNPAVESPPR